MFTTEKIRPGPVSYDMTRIVLQPVSGPEAERLRAILLAGWGLAQIKKIDVFVRPNAYSANFAIHTPENRYVLRAGKTLGPEKQKVIDDCKKYARTNGLPVPDSVPTKEGASYYMHEGQLYSLCERIAGVFFNGAAPQLKNAAVLLAKFHTVFQDYPGAEKVITICGDVYPRDEQKWRAIKSRAKEGRHAFDQRTRDWMNLVDEHGKMYRSEPRAIPRQVGHFDWHPQNLLFESAGDEIIGLLDFDLLRFAERARDVGLGMHKFGRVIGRDTTASLFDRCGLFLNAYRGVHALAPEEVELMPHLIYDEIRRKIIYILGKHYLLKDRSSDFDLEKQVVQMQELRELAERLG